MRFGEIGSSGAPIRYRARHVAFVFAWLVVTVIVPVAAIAQTCETPVTVQPVAPTSSTPVTLTWLGLLDDATCSSLAYAVRGNDILIEEHWKCVFEPLVETRRITIGPLPAGEYRVRFVDRLDDPDGTITCATFTVTAAAALVPVPLASPVLLKLLVVVVALAGVLVLRRGG